MQASADECSFEAPLILIVASLVMMSLWGWHPLGHPPSDTLSPREVDTHNTRARGSLDSSSCPLWPPVDSHLNSRRSWCSDKTPPRSGPPSSALRPQTPPPLRAQLWSLPLPCLVRMCLPCPQTPRASPRVALQPLSRADTSACERRHRPCTIPPIYSPPKHLSTHAACSIAPKHGPPTSPSVPLHMPVTRAGYERSTPHTAMLRKPYYVCPPPENTACRAVSGYPKRFLPQPSPGASRAKFLKTPHLLSRSSENSPFSEKIFLWGKSPPNCGPTNENLGPPHKQT